MASGKSTVGKQLSYKTKLPFIDLDKYIEEKENAPVETIFNTQGEVYFRLKEHQYLKELMAKKDDFILSLGGGTPCYANNMELLVEDKKTMSIYLQASIKTLVYRIEKSKQKRPLVDGLHHEKLMEFVAKHLFERTFFYEKATVKINIDNQTIKQTVSAIFNLLKI